MTKLPNIVLITIDSLRSDFVGYHNPKSKNTPFLDKLVKKSYVYTNTIAPGIPTFFCFPSIMTGNLPFMFGKYLGIPEELEMKTLPWVMKESGYSTMAFLADNPTLYPIYGYNQGFDHYYSGYDDKSLPLLRLMRPLWWIRERMPEIMLRLMDFIFAFRQMIKSPEITISGKKLNREIESYINNNHNKPFFLWIHYMDVHLPYFSGLGKYFYPELSRLSKAWAKFRFYQARPSSERRLKINSKRLVDIFMEAYNSCIRYEDEAIESIYNILKKKDPNTIFIITSDHGEGFMEHGLFHHEPYSLYNELIGVPLLINFPDGRSKKISKTVSLLSIAKTICSILDIDEGSFQGTNILDANSNSELNRITRILYKCRSPHLSLGVFDNKTEIEGFSELISYTTADYKYIMEKGGKIEELYDLRKDPQESNNIRRKRDFRVEKARKVLNKHAT